MAHPTCPDCGAEIETTDHVETETVDELTADADGSGPPRITLGADKRDLYRCKGCGTVLGVN